MCEFCKKYDFSRARISIDSDGANIELCLCNTKFSYDEQFNFCPNCGAELKKSAPKRTGCFSIPIIKHNTTLEVGDKVAVRALCECVHTIPDNDECRYICPFENDCECDECDNANERIFSTTISGICDEGTGVIIHFKDLNIEARITDLGSGFFIGENAEQQAEEYTKIIKGGNKH